MSGTALEDRLAKAQEEIAQAQVALRRTEEVVDRVQTALASAEEVVVTTKRWAPRIAVAAGVLLVVGVAAVVVLRRRGRDRDQA